MDFTAQGTVTADSETVVLASGTRSSALSASKNPNVPVATAP
jgi:hypothetical protein